MSKKCIVLTNELSDPGPSDPISSISEVIPDSATLPYIDSEPGPSSFLETKPQSVIHPKAEGEPGPLDPTSRLLRSISSSLNRSADPLSSSKNIPEAGDLDAEFSEVFSDSTIDDSGLEEHTSGKEKDGLNRISAKLKKTREKLEDQKTLNRILQEQLREEKKKNARERRSLQDAAVRRQIDLEDELLEARAQNYRMREDLRRMYRLVDERNGIRNLLDPAQWELTVDLVDDSGEINSEAVWLLFQHSKELEQQLIEEKMARVNFQTDNETLKHNLNILQNKYIEQSQAAASMALRH
eukprot:Rmarinus@m.20252